MNVLRITGILLLLGLQGVSAKNTGLRVQWFHQAQFAGYYAAIEKGYYKALGVDFTIEEGGPTSNGILEICRSEKVNFATAWLSGGMEFASKGTPIVNVAQIFPNSMLVLVANKKSNITKFSDMNGKKIGYWAGMFSTPIKTLVRQQKITPNLVEEGFDMMPFVNGNYDAIGEVISVMLYNEYNILLEKGMKESDLIIFNPKDFNANFPEDGLYVSQKYLSENKEIVQSVVKATLQGWQFVIDNEKEALDIVMKYSKGDRIHQGKMLSAIIKNIPVKAKVNHLLNEKDFNFVKDSLLNSGYLGTNEIKYSSFFNNVLK
ncbi:MAG: hypothetical protein A2015_15365 [Spirochaetes bacterium GWF1_31_7]|nr:MAG: hypothetical protein A2Y30_11785 [Spirochaetes bacterium GWE1_32_154]OHD51199.1 MAG: hypothetical protein A2Y29_01325 [Spirochaetes bacterium GWE2_31_10]OHD52116.1 MAG: hypothetical protein A2015_15365 [Spirochaetes bacterium GWF1_31_7]OHD75184.1 MAG: hypothetical protein A2355_08530 [Spirochaetes bacterium RIFOXYB1_FULL_32_8]HBD96300.1 hypothetical protein [Spirochaetia bacterium]